MLTGSFFAMSFPRLVLCGGAAVVLAFSVHSPAEAPKVFAHYYPWWEGNRPDYPLMPKRGWYVNQFRGGQRGQPASIFQLHIAQARSFKLSGFSVEWPGQRSPETRMVCEAIIPANNALPSGRRMSYLLCFDSTIWAMSYQKIIKNWYDPIQFDESTAEAFASEIHFVCESLPRMDPAFKESYLHIDGRPAVFVYNAHGFAGDWEHALKLARERCAAVGGVFLIGDFEVSPHPMFDGKRKEEYPRKASFFDAVTNYTLLSGYTTVTMHEYITTGQLAGALSNGRELGRSSKSGDYYPGIIAQYFKSRVLGPGEATARDCRHHMRDRTFVRDANVGYAPVYAPEERDSQAAVDLKSRQALEALIGATLATKPEIVFVTSWNEPYEGTMIEPTKTANPACYVMDADFVKLIERGLMGEALGDFDRDGDVDDDDMLILQRPARAGKSRAK